MGGGVGRGTAPGVFWGAEGGEIGEVEEADGSAAGALLLLPLAVTVLVAVLVVATDVLLVPFEDDVSCDEGGIDAPSSSACMAPEVFSCRHRLYMQRVRHGKVRQTHS